jgi:hypothetical protein
MVQNQSKSIVDNDIPETCRRVAQRQAENRERFWQVVEEIGERNADKDPDEVMHLVTEEVEEVRQERYEREQCTKRGR